jgi:hypothetical protein
LISILPLPVSQIEIKEHFNNVTEKSGISYELKKTKDLVLLTVHYVRGMGGHSPSNYVVKTLYWKGL